MKALEQVGFHVVGYGCTTCIGNSGPLPRRCRKAIKDGNLVAAAVLSGNRNFEGRVQPDVKANYLASPPLVVAYALAGTVDIDLDEGPLGTDRTAAGLPARDLADAAGDRRRHRHASMSPRAFHKQYANGRPGPAAAGARSPPRRATCSVRRQEHLHPGAAVLHDDDARVGRSTPSSARARSPCSATR
jgi:aconitase A